MKNRYEMIVVLSPDLDEAGIAKELGAIQDAIKSHDGTIESVDKWGRRQLAYQIDRKDYGDYTLIVFEAERSVVAAVERQLRITESVIRFLTVVKDKYAPDLSPKAKEDSGRERSSFRSRDDDDDNDDDDDDDRSSRRREHRA